MSGSDDSNRKSIINIENANVLGPKADAAIAGLLTKLLGRPAEEAGHLMADVVGKYRDDAMARRAENRRSILAEAAAELESRELGPKGVDTIDLNDADYVLQEISSIGNPDLQSMWAGLIANSLDPAENVTASRSNTALLTQIGPAEAAVLLAMFEQESLLQRRKPYGLKVQEKLNTQGVKLSPTELRDHIWKDVLLVQKDELSELVAFIESRGLNDTRVTHSAVSHLRRLGLIRIPKPLASPPKIARSLVGSNERQILTHIESLSKHVWNNQVQSNISAPVPEVIFEMHRQGRHLGLDPEMITEISCALELTPEGEALVSACSGVLSSGGTESE